MIRIYRKSDLAIVGTCLPNTLPEWEIKRNVIPNFGGSPEDYEVIRIDKKHFHLELGEDGLVNVVEDIQIATNEEDPEKVALYEAVAGLFEEVQALKNHIGGAK